MKNKINNNKLLMPCVCLTPGIHRSIELKVGKNKNQIRVGSPMIGWERIQGGCLSWEDMGFEF